MNNNRRVIDASRGWNHIVKQPPSNTNAVRQPPQMRISSEQQHKQQPKVSYVPRNNMRPNTQVPINVNPNANIIYQDQQVPKQNVESGPSTVHKAVPIQKETKQSTVFADDMSMKMFDIEGCKSMDEVYSKNKHLIKIIPE